MLFAQADLGKAIKLLQKEKCIDKEVAGELRMALNAEQLTDPLSFVERVQKLEFKRVLGGNIQPGEAYPPATRKSLDSLAQTQKPDWLVHCLENVAKAGLIDQNSNSKLRKKITAGEVRQHLGLLTALKDELVYRDKISYQKLLGFSQQLRANGLLAPNPAGGDLISAIDAGSIDDPFHMLDYCNNAHRFSAADYPGTPKDYLEKIHQKTASLLPDLQFNNFEYEVLPGFIKVRMQIGENEYWLASHFDPDKNGNSDSFEGRLDETSFYKIFNLALAEQGSLYRLHLVRSGLEAYEDKAKSSRFGMIALRQEQLEAFRYLGSYYQFSEENYKNALSRDLVSGVIDRYFSFGMFAHLTLQQYRNARDFATSNPRMSYEEILTCFPGVLLDPDALEPQALSPYGMLLQAFSKLSRQEFMPTEVQDDGVPGEARNFSFRLGEQTWSDKLVWDGKNLDPAFFKLLDKATKATLQEGRFYPLKDSPHWIFLNTEQWDLLYRQKAVGRQK